MNEREQLEQAIAALKAQRATLGDAVVNAALAPMREKFAALDRVERESATPVAAAGERHVVTILFCDAKGSTALAAQLDPEAWTGIMNRIVDVIRPSTVEDHGQPSPPWAI